MLYVFYPIDAQLIINLQSFSSFFSLIFVWCVSLIYLFILFSKGLLFIRSTF